LICPLSLQESDSSDEEEADLGDSKDYDEDDNPADMEDGDGDNEKEEADGGDGNDDYKDSDGGGDSDEEEGPRRKRRIRQGGKLLDMETEGDEGDEQPQGEIGENEEKQDGGGKQDRLNERTRRRDRRRRIREYYFGTSYGAPSAWSLHRLGADVSHYCHHSPPYRKPHPSMDTQKIETHNFFCRLVCFCS